MADLDSVLRDHLARLDDAHLRRELRPLRPRDGTRTVMGSDGRVLLNFSSNDYLGLASHPAVRAAAALSAQTSGGGSGASRLVCGSLDLHHALEAELAAFKGLPTSLTFSSGYAAALGTIPALVGPGDFVVLDRLAHASLVDAARLSGAKLRVFHHNDLEDLDRILDWADAQPARTDRKESGNVLIVTESVFSMDGDVAPLRELVSLKERHGAWLMVDEAHATGVLGRGGRGWIDQQGVTAGVEVSMGTLGKALGVAGGYIGGSAILCDYLVNRARSFVFSTAPPPAVVGAARAALGILASEDGETRMRRLWERLGELHGGLATLGFRVKQPTSAIVPFVVGDEEKAMRLSAALRDEGVFVPGIRFPTVARGAARLRMTLSASHGPEDVAQLLSALRLALDRTRIRPED